ncbi:hypothetical protein [Chryseobacterium contaminans]|uniref:Dolichyl-phosphate-mannose-protein mannosyltransferase n=2 Tax=Chryseobacterium contaminans TaxID=1423959 RepID=A0A1M7EFP7_9FLAO|nr:hypothetical protein [Chryseobacterium contaminans]SHL90537.1 hypothetical protein SAMN05444407_107165 [Chryseobacterium contaminans]
MNITFKEYYRKPLQYVLVILSVIYLCFICVYSVDQFDQGFIPSMIGRLQQGQEMYKDFDYIRPFFTLIFWDCLLKWIPSTSAYFILICRVLFVIQCFATTLIFQKLLFNKIRYEISFLFVICFIQTFPIMPWHTVDGIFFGAVSLYFYKRKWLLSTLVFLGITALTKQSFFVFSFGVFLFVCKDLFINRTLNKKDVVLSGASLLLLIFAVFQYHIIENFVSFWNFVFNTSIASSFYDSSIAPYLFKSKWQSALLLGCLVAIYFVKIKKEIFEYIVLILFPVLILYPLLNNGMYVGINTLFLFLIILFFKYSPDEREVFFLLFLGWASTISWGANIPTFFVFILMIKFLEDKNRFFLGLWLISLSAFFLLRLKYPYFSESILSSRHVLTKDIPAVSGLLMSEKEYEYIIEAKNLEKEYPNIIFLPGSPLLDVINGKYINRASWEMDVEYPTWKTDLYKLNANVFAVDEKRFTLLKDSFYKSTFTVEIMKKKRIIKKTKHFIVYGE